MFKRPETLIMGTLVLVAALVFGFKVMVFDNLRSYEHNATLVVPGGYISTVTVTGELRGEPFSLEANVRCHRAFYAYLQFVGWRWERHAGSIGFQIRPGDGVIVGLPSVCPCGNRPGGCDDASRTYKTDNFHAAWVDNVSEISVYEVVSRIKFAPKKGFGGYGAPIKNIQLTIDDGRGEKSAKWFSDDDITTENINFHLGSFNDYQRPRKSHSARVFTCAAVRSRHLGELEEFGVLLGRIKQMDRASGFLDSSPGSGSIEEWREVRNFISNGTVYGLPQIEKGLYSFDDKMDNRIICRFIFNFDEKIIKERGRLNRVYELSKLKIDDRVFSVSEVDGGIYFDSVDREIFKFVHPVYLLIQKI